MPPPSAFIRTLTLSIETMRFTETFAPTSRSTSSHCSPPIQSRLFTSFAPVGPSPNDTIRPICAAIAFALPSISSGDIIFRAASLPEGSPTRPVAPPTSTSGR